MNLRFIKTPEKRDIIKVLADEFGITEFPHLLLETGKEKIRAYTGSLSKDEIISLSKIINIELVGLYFIKKEHDLRLTIEAAHFLKDQIKHHVIELNEFQFNEWIRGRDLELEIEQGTYAISYNKDFIGCGKSNGKKVFNYVPKDRRLRK